MSRLKWLRRDSLISIRIESRHQWRLSTLLRCFRRVFAAEALHTTGSIDKFLLTGKIRVAVGAYFHADRLAGRTRRIRSATGTRYHQRVVFGMNSGFHYLTTSISSLFISNDINNSRFRSLSARPQPSNIWNARKTAIGELLSLSTPQIGLTCWFKRRYASGVAAASDLQISLASQI